MDNFTSTVLKGGHSSPSVYLVTCTVPHAKPDKSVVKLDRAVVKVEGEVPEHTFKVRFVLVESGKHEKKLFYRYWITVIVHTRAGLQGNIIFI